MPTPLDRAKVKQHLDNFDLLDLFTQELGWDHGGSDTEVTVKDRAYPLQAIAHKRGMVAYQYLAQPGEDFPDHPTRQQVERRVAKQVREHIIIFADHDRSAQYWLWVKREPGRPDRPRTHIYRSDQSGEPLIQKLERIVFTLEDEADLSIVDVTGHVLAAFDVEKVTRKFYDRFKKEHQDFLGFIEGINNLADREWYASLMLNRMMFIYFIQKRGFLDNDPDYLRERLHIVRQQHGAGRFVGFYRLFLLKLFHEGLGQPEAERDPELIALLGQVPYLNGGLFDVHDLERDYPDIDIPDEAFAQIFAFFDAYQWHLDDRPLRDDNEINPDVLGYIFEKYINQKQMGAYYTKEDITGYISRNTIIPSSSTAPKRVAQLPSRPAGVYGVCSRKTPTATSTRPSATASPTTFTTTRNWTPNRPCLPTSPPASTTSPSAAAGTNRPRTHTPCPPRPGASTSPAAAATRRSTPNWRPARSHRSTTSSPTTSTSKSSPRTLSPTAKGPN